MIATKHHEMALLACVCSNNEFVTVPLAYFQNERLRALYAKLEDQHYRTGQIEPAVYAETFADIISDMDNVSFPKSPAPIIDELAQAHKANSAWVAAHQLIRNIEAGDSIDGLLKDATKKLSDLTMENNSIDIYDHAKSVFAFGNSVEIASRSPVARKGISSGLPDIDNIINGWQQGYTYIIGGLKKTGKSRFALHIMANFLKNGNGGIFFSLEMKSPQVHGCIISNRAKINTGKYGTNKISCTEMNLFSREMQEYMAQPMILCEKSGITPDYIRAHIRKQKITTPVKWVAVDYIQRVKCQAESRTKEIERIATELSDIARDENVIMIILSQLSGEAERNVGKTNIPIYAFVKESQTIIEACDCAIILTDANRGKEYDFDQDPDNGSKRLKGIVLQRDGVSDIWVEFDAELQYSKFTCIEKKMEEQGKW